MNDASSRFLASLSEATLIGLTGAMLLVKVFTGALPLYVHVRYTPLIALTGLLLLLLALVRGWLALRDDPEAHSHEERRAPWHAPARLALLVPVLLGLLIPSRALGSAAIDTRGLGTAGTGMRTVESVAGSQGLGIPDPTRWTMLDWVNALLYEPDNPRLQGQSIELIGFVWRPDGMADDQFMLSRFVVACCTADSLAIGMPVVWPDAQALPRDGWMRVTGTVALGEVLGEQQALIEAQRIVPIPQPPEPYLYP